MAAVAISYAPAWQGQSIWDDDAHLTEPALQSLGGLARIWTEPGATQQYYPLVHTVFWIEHLLWGDVTLPYHLVNILLHVVGALLFLRILETLKVPGAWMAAAIFALHPVQVESVAWISELKNVLSAVFFFGAFLLYLRFDRLRQTPPYVLSLAALVAGLLCKTVIATFPAALLVVLWWKRGKISLKRDVFPLVPFFVAGIGAGLNTAWMERRFIGAEGASFDLGFVERCLIAGRAIWFYLGKLIWPANLVFIYPRWQINASLWWQYLFPVATIALLTVLFALRKRWRAPLAGLLLFCGILFPALGFFNVYPFIFSFVADHFQYLASAAPFALFAAGLTLLFQRLAVPPAVRYGISFVLLIVLAGLTWRQAGIYRNAETLYRTTLAQNPSSWMVHNNLAIILIDQNRLKEAAEHAKAALDLRPDYPKALMNLGNISLKQGQPDYAIACYRKAMALEPRLPDIHTNFGNALRFKGDFVHAIQEYEQAIVQDPQNVPPRNNLAWLLTTCPVTFLRDGAKAVQLATQADRLSQGNNVIVLHTLAAACAQNGDFTSAVETARRALRLASAQDNVSLSAALRHEIELYQSGSTFQE